jgi:hypothetical protein
VVVEWDAPARYVIYDAKANLSWFVYEAGVNYFTNLSCFYLFSFAGIDDIWLLLQGIPFPVVFLFKSYLRWGILW